MNRNRKKDGGTWLGNNSCEKYLEIIVDCKINVNQQYDLAPKLAIIYFIKFICLLSHFKATLGGIHIKTLKSSKINIPNLIK